MGSGNFTHAPNGAHPQAVSDTTSKPYLILLATTTREKLDQYRTIARAKHMPVEFRLLTDVERYFHTAPEDTGDRVKNADQKLKEIDQNIAALRQEGSPSNLALRQKCSEWGVEYNPSRIFFATDDSTFTVARNLWPGFKKRLSAYVEEDLLRPKKLKKVPEGKEDNEVGPGAEFGPVVAAAGMTRFFNLLREAALEAKVPNGHAGITQHVTLLLHRMDADPSEPPQEFTAKKHVYLHTPLGLDVPLAEPADPIVKTDHYIHEKARNVPLSDYWQEYVIHRHERADVMDQLKTKVLHVPHGYVPAAQPAREVSKRSFTAGLPVEKQFDGLTRSLVRRGIHFQLPDDVYSAAEGAQDKKPYDAVSQESLISKSDALIFTPFHPTDGVEARTANYLAFFSAKVAKMLIARDANKPIIVMNLNHCWQDAIDTSMDLVNKGMFKDHLMRDYEEHPVPQTRGVHHMATRYYDVLTSDSPEKLQDAALKLLDHRRQSYIPFGTPEEAQRQDAFLSGGPNPLPPEDMFKVAVFVSAQNDNKHLLMDMRSLGKDLSRHEYGLIWGGGDRHGMGAVYEGYKSYRKDGKKHWMAAFSTESILRSETEYGHIPRGVDYWEQNIDIYQRMAHMIHHDNEALQANAIVVAPGGDGTVQEWLSALYLKQQFPETLGKKPLIIYTPDIHNGHDPALGPKPYWEKGIKMVMGEEFYDKIVKEHEAYKSDGIYLATNKKELMDLLAKLRIQERMDASHLGRYANGRAKGDAITRH